jgi:hypothetical protein
MVDDAIWQICIYGLCVGVVIAVMLGLPPLLGERHWGKRLSVDLKAQPAFPMNVGFGQLATLKSAHRCNII